VKIPRERASRDHRHERSGKSTLAFDILFAEGKKISRQHVAYGAAVVEQLEKPRCRSVEGLPPSVGDRAARDARRRQIDVATVTEVYISCGSFAKTERILSRLQFAGRKQSVAAIVKQVEAAAKRGPLKVLAPLVKARKAFSHRCRALGGNGKVSTHSMSMERLFRFTLSKTRTL